MPPSPNTPAGGPESPGDSGALFPPLPEEMAGVVEGAERAPLPEDYPRLLETICGATDDSQDVEQYDGTLGVTAALVNVRQSPVGQVQWNANLAAIYTNPGNVSGVRWGSGTQIAGDLFLTAGHLFDQSAGDWRLPLRNGTTTVISPQEIATNMHVNFNFQFDPAGNPRAEQSFAIVELVEYRLGGLDFAVVRLNGYPAFGTSRISRTDAAVGDMACIIGHPAGLPKRIEAGPVTALAGADIRYNDIDTLGGNSGSGILRAADGLLVGVHTNGGCNPQSPGPSGGSNFGVRMTSIRGASPTVEALSQFSPVYAQGDPGAGIGGYDLQSPNDRAFAFDFDSSGKLDHLALYRPGGGAIFILKHTGGANFTPVYAQGDPGAGIGGYDLQSPNDRAFAFDFDSSGKLDHLALYRPGGGAIFILKHTGGANFTPVYAQGDPGAGIGGYDLQSPQRPRLRLRLRLQRQARPPRPLPPGRRRDLHPQAHRRRQLHARLRPGRPGRGHRRIRPAVAQTTAPSPSTSTPAASSTTSPSTARAAARSSSSSTPAAPTSRPSTPRATRARASADTTCSRPTTAPSPSTSTPAASSTTSPSTARAAARSSSSSTPAAPTSRPSTPRATRARASADTTCSRRTTAPSPSTTRARAGATTRRSTGPARGPCGSSARSEPDGTADLNE